MEKVKSIMVLDIETLPNKLDENMSKLLDHKVRNEEESKKERKKLEYRFHEPAYARICCISTYYHNPIKGVDQERTFFSRDNEKEVLENFINYISSFKGVFVHFNGLDFDIPFILFKCCQYGIEPPPRFCNLIRFRTDPHFDIFQLLNAWGKFRLSLAEACEVFGIKNSKDELHGLDTLTFLSQASDEDIQIYNKADVFSTFKLYQKGIKVFQ